MIIKSEGVNDSERLLANLCDKTFLKLWSYPNPFNEKQVELCDVLAVFEDNIFVFFDRSSRILDNKEKDINVIWNRWKKEVIDKQIRTANGVERYIRSGRKIFLDQKLEIPLPIKFDCNQAKIHKIIIAHGAEEACRNFFGGDSYGSLAMEYSRKENANNTRKPFFIHVDKENPVHIFDSFNLKLIFDELDTIYDFSEYLNAKTEAINKYELFVYSGEEDLLAFYFMNFNKSTNKHYIAFDGYTGGLLDEGLWEVFIKRDEYKNKKKEDKISYIWDNIIQKTCGYALEGRMIGSSTLFDGRSAIHEMAKEPRFVRRELSKIIIKAIEDFPEPVPSAPSFLRKVSLIDTSFYKNKAYLFLQLHCPVVTREEYRQFRLEILKIACGAAKNEFSHLTTIVGIATDPPEYSDMVSVDFNLMDGSNWTDEQRMYYEEENEQLNFFKTKDLTVSPIKMTEFPQESRKKISQKTKIGRNDPCPCGSDRKYKKCCINIKLS